MLRIADPKIFYILVNDEVLVLVANDSGERSTKLDQIVTLPLTCVKRHEFAKHVVDKISCYFKQ
jgi:hypothetical protein